MHLEFVNIFSPNLTRPKHAWFWYFINVLKVIFDDVCFLANKITVFVNIPKYIFQSFHVILL